MRRWLLVPSPLLGPSSWVSVADWLNRQGQCVSVAETTMTTTATEDHVMVWVNQILASVDLGSEQPLVVVGHSAACPRLPYLVQQLMTAGLTVEAMGLVDGRMPDGLSFSQYAPKSVETLDALTRPDDYLPPWPNWWGSLIPTLVIDPIIREKILSEAQPIPRSWFDQPCPAPNLSDVAKFFLGFGQSYSDARQRAKGLGWLTAVLFGHHLHQLEAPDSVGGTLVGLVSSVLAGKDTKADKQR